MLRGRGIAWSPGAFASLRTVHGLRARMLVMSMQRRRRHHTLKHERDHDEEPQPAGKRMAHAYIVGEGHEGDRGNPWSDRLTDLTTVICVQDLSHRYAGAEVLRLPAWNVAPGERWLVHGPSGCGKTTLLHVIAGLVRPSAGRVKVAGEDLLALRGSALDHWRGANVGIVLQAMHLVPHLRVLDNMRLAQYLAQVPQDDARVAETLAALGVADKAARRPGELSQGEQQRIAIARAVVNGPKLLLADEPTASLDDEAAARAVELLSSQAEKHRATLVVATHDARVKQHFEKRLELPA